MYRGRRSGYYPVAGFFLLMAEYTISERRVSDIIPKEEKHYERHYQKGIYTD